MDSRGIQHVWGTYCWRRTLEEGLGSGLTRKHVSPEVGEERRCLQLRLT